MELIVASFLATFLAVIGHLTSVISDQLRRPKARVWRFAEGPHDPLPPKRAPIRLGTAGVKPARA